MMRDSTPLAAIDVGTNSVHMVIARPVDGGTPEVLAREKVSVRLGQGATDMKHLAPDAIERAVAALTEFRHIADAYGAEVVAVATSAVREAENRRDFQQRVRDETGVAVEVIPGTEEARLIHLGALSAVPAAGRPHLVLDIGGGSTELIVSTGTEPQLVRSVKLGHIRLTDRFFPGGIIRAGAVEECRRHIRSFVAPEARRARAIGFDLAVGCSGTIAALASMAASSRGKRRPRSVANTTIDRDELDRTVAEVLARPHPDDRRDLRGLERTRRDVIVGGAVLLSQLFEDLGMESLVISTGALREGVLLDRFSRRQESPADGLHHLGDLRRSSVMALARSYHEDLIHAEHATEMALQLFDETQHVHGLGDRDSEL
ncbi:MAG: Ppx/GppA phosphatase family protein, partial [bacterium]|nr:Ppx/GppA phosphatase family protein [bacterium]